MHTHWTSVSTKHVACELNFEVAHPAKEKIISFLSAFRMMSTKVNMSMIMWNLMDIEDFFPGHIIINSAESSIWKSRSVVRRCLKPHLEVSFQNSNLKAFPAKNLDGLFHEVNFQCF